MMIMASTEPPSPVDAAIDFGQLPSLLGYALRRAQLAVFEDLHRSMEAEALRPTQFAVLHLLKHNPGLRQSRLSGALGVKTSNFVPLFDALERRGLTERRSVAGDRRAKGLFLTPEGEQVVQRLERQVGQHDARFAHRLGTEGRHQLLGLLHRLADPAFDRP